MAFLARVSLRSGARIAAACAHRAQFPPLDVGWSSCAVDRTSLRHPGLRRPSAVAPGSRGRRLPRALPTPSRVSPPAERGSTARTERLLRAESLLMGLLDAVEHMAGIGRMGHLLRLRIRPVRGMSALAPLLFEEADHLGDLLLAE